MYKIYADNELIYDSTIDDYKIGKGEITLETNKSGSFVFSLYPDHFYYDRFVRLATVITVYKRDKIIFRGRILNDVTDHWNNKVITCEGELGFLQDSIVRPFDFTGTPRELLTKFITEHNAQVDSFKKFKIGEVTVTDPNNSLSRNSNTYDTTISSLTARTIESDIGGYLYITHGADGRESIPTIHWVKDFTKFSTQTIEFGVNLKNYTKTVKGEDIATAIIPLGAELTDENEDGNESGTSRRITIESVNDGKDYIYDPDAVAFYGWIFKTVEFNDVTIPSNLKTKAMQYLKTAILHPTTIELGAIDLNLLNPEIESISVNEYIRGISTPHNFDETLLCSKQIINILKPDNDSYVLGYTYSSFASNNSKLLYAVSQIKNDYASKASVAEKITQTKTDLVVESERILSTVETTYATRDALATGLNAVSSEISQSADAILASVEATYATSEDVNEFKDSIRGELALEIVTAEDGSKYSQLSADVDKIKFESGEIEITSDNFSLTPDGTITAKDIAITGGDIQIPLASYSDAKAVINGQGVGCSNMDDEATSGTEIRILPKLIVYSEGGVGGYQWIQPGVIDGSFNTYCVGNWKFQNEIEVVSDRTKKHSIENQPESYSRIFDALRPVIFKYNDGNSERYHTGFIAQDVEDAVISAGLTTKDFAGVCYELDSDGNKVNYGVRYGEIVSLNTYEIQKLKARIAELEKIIEEGVKK